MEAGILEVYLGPYQTSMMNLFCENSYRFTTVSYFLKGFIIVVSYGPKYAFEANI